jgi:hypothetical protein
MKITIYSRVINRTSKILNTSIPQIVPLNRKFNDGGGYNKNDSIDNSRLLGVPQLIDW